MIAHNFNIIRQVATVDYMSSFPNLHYRYKKAHAALRMNNDAELRAIQSAHGRKDMLSRAHAVTLGDTGRVRFRVDIAPRDYTEEAKQEIIKWVGQLDQALAQVGFE